MAMLRLQAFLCGSDVSSLAGCFFFLCLRFHDTRLFLSGHCHMLGLQRHNGVCEPFYRTDFASCKFDPSHSPTAPISQPTPKQKSTKEHAPICKRQCALSPSLTFAPLAHQMAQYNNQNQLIYHSDSKRFRPIARYSLALPGHLLKRSSGCQSLCVSL